MTAFAKPIPLTEQITAALRALRHARQDGNADMITFAAAELDGKLARYRCAHTLAETFPELDQHLRVTFT